MPEFINHLLAPQHCSIIKHELHVHSNYMVKTAVLKWITINYLHSCKYIAVIPWCIGSRNFLPKWYRYYKGSKTFVKRVLMKCLQVNWPNIISVCSLVTIGSGDVYLHFYPGSQRFLVETPVYSVYSLSSLLPGLQSSVVSLHRISPVTNIKH